ncbi:carboxymuconolactone decarboxylase family protein [Hominifimenecus sp. rT4P-3]|uniref:carboxymuconolactone decarboxylase family protein n=1 Tax=Hominifimenecus sp. rT4P-3 TaxID=3242979 RepID=UPI003DA3334C
MEQKEWSHWDIMEQYDPELSKSVTEWRNQLGKDPVIPHKYQELMKVAMASVLRFDAAIKGHAAAAMKFGASREELFETLALSMMLGGIPAYREASTVLKEILIENTGRTNQ